MTELLKKKEITFSKLYQQYIDEIYQFVLIRTGYEQSVAEDIAQDIFLDVYKSLDRFHGLCSERTWIYKIAKNKLFDFYRKQYSQKDRTQNVEEMQELSDDNQDMDLYLNKQFVGELVKKCLLQLSTPYRVILIQKYVEELSMKEIAATCGKSEKAVESMLQRAKKEFKKLYEEQEGKKL